MKKIIAAVLAIFCLAGCSAKEQPAVTEEPPVVEAPVEQPAQEQPAPPAVVEVPMEIIRQEPEAEQPGDNPVETVDWSTSDVEGLSGDAVGYVLQVPAFANLPAAETINAFYTDLVAGLAEHAEDKVHTQCLEKGCVANVYGEVTAVGLLENELTVSYEYRVEFSNSDTPTIHNRTDHFNTQTGEIRSE